MAAFKKELNYSLLKPNYDKDLFDMVSEKIGVVSDRGNLVNNDSASKLAITVES